MKIKKIIFTSTGEIRTPQTGEWYKTSEGAYTQYSSLSPHEIYTHEEIEEEWIPKNGEQYFMPEITNRRSYAQYYYTNESELCKYHLENKLVYPTKHLAIAEAERILKLREENK